MKATYHQHPPSAGRPSCFNFHEPILSNLYKGEDEPFIYQENAFPDKWVTVEIG
jgi:hypothetical protein